MQAGRHLLLIIGRSREVSRDLIVTGQQRGHRVRMRHDDRQRIKLGILILAIGLCRKHPQDDRLHGYARHHRDPIAVLEVLDAIDVGVMRHHDRRHRTQRGEPDISAPAFVPQHDQGGQAAIGNVEISGEQRLVHPGAVAEAAPGDLQVLQSRLFGLVLDQLQLVHQGHCEMGYPILPREPDFADFGASFLCEKSRHTEDHRQEQRVAGASHHYAERSRSETEP